MTEKKSSGASAAAQSVATKFGIIAINACTGILTARTLAPAGRGDLATLILWPILLAGVFTFGVPSATTYMLRSQPERASNLAGAALFIACCSGVIAALVGALALPSWLTQYGADVVLWAQVLVLSAPLQSLALVGRAALESRDRFGSSNSLLIASPLLTLLWLIVLVFTHTITPLRAALAYVTVGIVPAVWMLYQLWQLFHPTLRNLRASLTLLLSYGLRSYGIDLCGTLALYVDQALVVRLLSPTWMGIYVVALSLSRMLNAFHMSVIMVLFPRTVSQHPDHVRAITARATRITTLLTACAGVVVIALGPQVLHLLYGSKYIGAASVLRVLTVEVVLAGATTVLSQAYMALGRPGIVTILQIAGLLITVPLMLWLIPLYGITGAGLALLASTTLRLVAVLAGFPLFLKQSVPLLWPQTEDLHAIRRLLRREA